MDQENDNEPDSFQELQNLLSNSRVNEQMSLDDKIEICSLQKQVLEIKNFGLEESIKLKSNHLDKLNKRRRTWADLNSHLNRLIETMVELKNDVNQFKLELHLTFERKLNYLNFLLKLSKESLNKDKLKQFLIDSSSHQNYSSPLSPLSIVERDNYFEIQAIKNLNYDLDSLMDLTRKVEKELKCHGTDECDDHHSNYDRVEEEPYHASSNRSSVSVYNEESAFDNLKTIESNNSDVQDEFDDDDGFPDEFFDHILPCSQFAKKSALPSPLSSLKSKEQNETVKENAIVIELEPSPEKTTQISVIGNSRMTLTDDNDGTQANFTDNDSQVLKIDLSKESTQISLIEGDDDEIAPSSSSFLPSPWIANSQRSNFNQTSDASGRFFTDQSGESVIVKNRQKQQQQQQQKPKTTKKRADEDDDELLDFDTSLSSQIAFN